MATSGKKNALEVRHRTRCFAAPSAGSARSFSPSVPFLTSARTGMLHRLCSLPEKAHPTDAWVFSPQAAPASQLDNNLKITKNLSKIIGYASEAISGLSAYHYTLGLRQTARSSLHEHLNKDPSSLWPCLLSLGIHPGQISQRMFPVGNAPWKLIRRKQRVMHGHSPARTPPKLSYVKNCVINTRAFYVLKHCRSFSFPFTGGDVSHKKAFKGPDPELTETPRLHAPGEDAAILTSWQKISW